MPRPLPGAEQLRFQQPALYARQGSTMTQCAVADYAELLLRLHAQRRPLLVWLHGRGDEPAKSLLDKRPLGVGGALATLDGDHDVAALMVNWNSKSKRQDRRAPLNQTDSAAAAFLSVAQQQAALVARFPELPRPVLLVHSMGAIVLQKAVSSPDWPGARLFARVVISQPDAELGGHAAWLQKLAQREEVWVTWNAHDLTLGLARSARQCNERPLGRGDFANEPRAPAARYLNLSFSGRGGLPSLSHTMFEADSLRFQAHARSLMRRLLRGEAIAAPGVDADLGEVGPSGDLHPRPASAR